MAYLEAGYQLKKKERTQNEQDKTSLLKRSETSNVHGEISKI